MKRICVFCGASAGENIVYREAASHLGTTLARQGIGVVYGGASIGLMGSLADSALSHGAQVIGVIPQGLVDREVAHADLKDLRVVRSMHERKAVMEQLSDGFIALPGGFGTLDELCEIVTWSQLGIHGKPIGLLNVNGYFDKFLQFLDHAVKEGFVKPQHRGLLHVSDDATKLVEQLKATPPTIGSKWTVSGSPTPAR